VGFSPLKGTSSARTFNFVVERHVHPLGPKRSVFLLRFRSQLLCPPPLLVFVRFFFLRVYQHIS